MRDLLFCMPGKSDKHAPVVNFTVYGSISLVDTKRHGCTLVRLHHCNLFLPASIRMWVRSSTSGIRRDEVSMSRFSFSHFSQFIVISHTACTVRMVIEESSPVRSGHSAPHDSFEY